MMAHSRPTTILARERDALGNQLCIYRRHRVYHVGMVLHRGRCVPLIRSLYVTYTYCISWRNFRGGRHLRVR
jgi:hypothetical protein